MLDAVLWMALNSPEWYGGCMHKDWFKPIYYRVRIWNTNYWYGTVSYGYSSLPSRCEWIVPGSKWLP